MSEEIIKILDDLGRRFGIAIDWSSENVMPYLKDLMSRFVKYETATSILWMLLGVIILSVCLAFAIRMFKSDDLDTQCLAILPCMIALIGVAIIVCQAIDIITVNTIPEKMIYEYLSNSIS